MIQNGVNPRLIVNFLGGYFGEEFATEYSIWSATIRTETEEEVKKMCEMWSIEADEELVKKAKTILWNLRTKEIARVFREMTINEITWLAFGVGVESALRKIKYSISLNLFKDIEKNYMVVDVTVINKTLDKFIKTTQELKKYGEIIGEKI